MSHRTFRGVRFLATGLLLTVSVSAAQADLRLDSSPSASAIESVLQGPGLNIENIRIVKGAVGQYGLFHGGTDPVGSQPIIGMHQGLFMTTGHANSILGTNDRQDYTYNTHIEYSDVNLLQLSQEAYFDPVIIEFDMIPEGDQLNFMLVFGSEEYPEYVCSKFNDAFGLFVSGPGWNGMRNAAFLPGTNTPITVNNINAGKPGSDADGSQCKLNNAIYFVENIPNGQGTQLDGFSRPLLTSIDQLQAGKRYRVKLALADTADQAFDSAVFFKWLTSTQSTPVDLALQAQTATNKPEKGGYVDVTYTVKNQTNRSTRLVKVGLELPTGVSLVSSDAGNQFDQSKQEWHVGDMPANGSRTLKLRVNVGNSQSYHIPAEIIYAFNEDPDSTPFNRLIRPSEDDTQTLTLYPVSNTAPQFDTANRPDTEPLHVPENTTGVLIDLDASDAEGDTESNGLTWHLEGTDAALFTIDAQGRLSFKSSPNYEQAQDQDLNNQYEVIAKVCDRYNSCSTQTLSLQVTDVAEDNDNDGLHADDELALGTDPDKADSDGDGLNDLFEIGGNVSQPRDSDGDGVIDALDADDDNDGVLSRYEIGVDPSNPKDNDGDGTPDYLDTDDDGDGVLTAQEAPDPDNNGNPTDARDSDADGKADYLDTDDDGDGKLTASELGSPHNLSRDSDGDGTPDYLDSNDNDGVQGDFDGDGISNGREAELGSNPNHDDSDGDGISDTIELGSDPTQARDSDQDGTPDILDSDDDNDGIYSRHEVGADPNNPQDTDGDGIPDYLDQDDDGDGLLTRYENPDPNNDHDPQDAQDSDKDGTPNYLDNDDDGDGTNTADEQADPNNDGNQEDAADDDLDNIADYIDAEVTPYVRLKVRAFLQGAYNHSKKRMRTALYEQGLLPEKQPYDSIHTTMGYTNSPDFAPAFEHYGSEQLSDAVAKGSGDNAIVDWVLVEVRDAEDPSIRLATRAAVLQSDGDIVEADSGSMELLLHDIEPGDYYVAVDHRNHLGVMTAKPVNLAKSTSLVDFSSMNTNTYGGHAQADLYGDVQALYAGDINNSKSLINKGAGSDSSVIRGVVMIVPVNEQANYSFKLKGYYTTDSNLDGVTIAEGPNNDMNLIGINVLMHPQNSAFSPEFVIPGHLPTHQ